MQFLGGMLVGMVLLWILIASGEVPGPESECEKGAYLMCGGHLEDGDEEKFSECWELVFSQCLLK